MPGRIRQPVTPAALALAVIVLLLGRQLVWPSRTAPQLTHALPERITITDVRADGTLVSGVWGPLRLLGVQFPEAATTADERVRTQAIGTARPFLFERCAGRFVRLEWDRHRRTRDGVSLAVVFVGGDCINEQLIAAGLARFDDTFPLRSDLQRRLQKAEERARKAKRGLWAPPQR